MSASIGNLAVMLSANTSQFRSGMRSATSATRKFSSDAEQSLASVPSALGRIAAAAAGLAATFLSVRAGMNLMFGELNRLDELGKTAERLGFTTAELSRLQFAGEQTGVSVETMNMALQRMTRRVAEAAAGTGEAKAAIAELGLDADRLNKSGPAKTFEALAAAIGKVEDPGNRVRLAMKLFDSEGVRLVNTLNLGAEGLAEMSKRSDELGNTVFTGSSAAAEFNDAINELKKAIGGTAAELVRSLIPSIKAFVDGMTTAVTKLRDFNIDSVKNVVQITAMAAAFGATVAAAGKFVSLGIAIIKTIKDITKAAVIAQMIINPASLVKVIAGMGAAVAAGVLVEKMFEDIGQKAAEATEGAKKTREEIQKMTDAAGDRMMLGIFDKFIGEIRDATKDPEPFKYLKSDLTELNRAMDSMRSKAAAIFEATRTPAEKFAAKMREISELVSKGYLSQDTARRAIAQLNMEQQQRFVAQSMPDLNPQRVSFEALGAEAAAGRGQDKLEKNTAEEVKISKSIDANIDKLVKQGATQRQIATVIASF